MIYNIVDETCIIRCERQHGLFSNIFELINFFHFFEKNNISFKNLNISNFSLLYSNDGTSTFNNYFSCEINHKNKINKKIFYGDMIDYGFDHNNIGTCDIYFNDDKRKYIKELFDKYLLISGEIINNVNLFVESNLLNKKTLGVHVRRTDHNVHGNIIDINRILNDIDNKINLYDVLYLMTDDLNMIELFKNKYQDKLVCYSNITRSYNNVGVHFMSNIDRIKIGNDVLTEVLTLSKCDEIIITNSNVSMFAICSNTNVKFTLIDLKYDI